MSLHIRKISFAAMGNTGTFCARKPSKQEPNKPELEIIVY